jgi:hypothetical protein
MKTKNFLFQNLIPLAFLVSFIYWVYLALTSSMIIEYDAVNYESLGKMLAGKGWLEYFRTGPHREPLYPLLVSFSMRIGGIFSLSYQPVQVFLQLLILFITQLMTLRVLRILNINNWLCALTILYLGVSPAIVNSALSLFSEIATYPLILATVLIMHKSWLSLSGPKSRTVILAILSGLIFILMTLSKGIFEFITPVFIILFLLPTLLGRNRKIILRSLLYLAVFSAIFYAHIIGYKSVSRMFNDNFAVTNRGLLSFYAGAARRTEPLTRESLLSAIAYVPGRGVCYGIFGREKCRFWVYKESDRLGLEKIYKLKRANLSAKEVDKEFVSGALTAILHKPGQYILLWFIEGLKIFFWESTQIGFVGYPAGLAKLFGWAPLKNGLRFFISSLVFLAFIYAVIFLFGKRKNIFTTKGNAREKPVVILYLSILLIFLFAGAYAFNCIFPRLAFPVVPLQLIILAFAVQKIFVPEDFGNILDI